MRQVAISYLRSGPGKLYAGSNNPKQEEVGEHISCVKPCVFRHRDQQDPTESSQGCGQQIFYSPVCSIQKGFYAAFELIQQRRQEGQRSKQAGFSPHLQVIVVSVDGKVSVKHGRITPKRPGQNIAAQPYAPQPVVLHQHSTGLVNSKTITGGGILHIANGKDSIIDSLRQQRNTTDTQSYQNR